MHQWPATLHTHLTKHRDTVASPYKKHSSWAIIYIFFFSLTYFLTGLPRYVEQHIYISWLCLSLPTLNISNPTYSILIQFDIKTESRIKERFAPVRHNVDLVKLSALIWETFDGFCVFPENHSGLDTVASLLHVRGSVRLRSLYQVSNRYLYPFWENITKQVEAEPPLGCTSRWGTLLVSPCSI